MPRGIRTFAGLLVAAVVVAPLGAPSSAADRLIACPASTATVHSSAPGPGKTVALTFDDGPGPSTHSMLRILRRTGVKATFFNLGIQLSSHLPDLQDEVTFGDVVGNHSWHHYVLTSLSAAEQAREIDRATAAIERLTGVRPCVFRPPYGAYNATTLRIAASRGLNTWTWSVDTEDWKANSSAAEYWVRRIVRRAQAGLTQRHPVVLMHNAGGGNPATVAALPQVISMYRSHGYRFVRLR